MSNPALRVETLYTCPTLVRVNPPLADDSMIIPQVPQELLDLRERVADLEREVGRLSAQESRYMRALQWLAKQVDRPDPPLCASCKQDGHSPWFCAALKHVDEAQVALEAKP